MNSLEELKSKLANEIIELYEDIKSLGYAENKYPGPEKQAWDAELRTKFHDIITRTHKAAIQAAKDAVPKERELYKHLDGSIVCRLCEKTDDEGCVHDWNAAIQQTLDNLNKLI